MIGDLRSDSFPGALDADVCVVGAGPVGITLALELSRRGRDVVLLESGGHEIDPALQDLYTSTNVGHPHNGINLGRYRAFGGTSTQWGGQILPFERIDFEKRDWVEASGWPITFDDLDPYYRRALKYEGLGGAISNDMQVWSVIGANGPNYEDGLHFQFSRWCPQPDFAKIYVKEISDSTSLRCILYATVTALSCANEQIVMAHARTLNGKAIEIKARRFIFCVGGIESARLLLQPLADQTLPPWLACSNVLGRYFQDHPTFECADIRPRNEAALHQLMDMVYFRGFKYQPRIYLSEERQRKTRSLNAGGLVLFKTAISAQVRHQVRVAANRLLRGPFSVGVLAEAIRSGVHAGPLLTKAAWRYFAHGRAFNPSDLGYRLLAFVEQAPNPESRITLSGETDAFGMRRAQLDWRLGQAEVDTLDVFARTVKMAFESAGLADVDIEPLVAARDPAMLKTAWDNYHNMGTARMADSPEYGVVDRSLKIFGSSNGYICSGAVFPTGSFANPTHTIIALALRLADHLCSESVA